MADEVDVEVLVADGVVVRTLPVIDGLWPETEANHGRCRCGVRAVEDSRGCEWHPSVRRERLRVLQQAITPNQRHRDEMAALAEALPTVSIDALRLSSARTVEHWTRVAGRDSTLEVLREHVARLEQL